MSAPRPITDEELWGSPPVNEQDRVAARAKADPSYRQMLMEDADMAAEQAADRPRPLRLPPGMRWQAQRDGVGHLLPKTNAAVLRYLCNRMPVNDRFAWPMRSRCPECVRLLEEGRA